MIGFTKRNLKVFFRDRSAVFFSLLSTLIIIGLYVLFLGNAYISNMSEIENAREIMNSWIMAGILATTSVSTTMGAFSFMVYDKVEKINKDFLSSPINRRDLAGGYVISALIIGFVLTMVTLLLAVFFGGVELSMGSIIKIIILILLTDLSNSAMMFFITTFFHSSGAFSTASTVIGTLIGFLTGIYLPIGHLPESVRWLVKLFPTSHAAVLLRQTMMEHSLSYGFSGIPKEYLTDFKHTMGVTFTFAGNEVSSVTSIMVLLVSAVVFFVLGMMNFSKKQRT